MIGGNKPQGFTIIETMIFLAMSAFIFLSVLTLINGQQDRTDFSTGVKEFATQIQQVANQVQNGVYNSVSDFTCQADVSGGTPGQDPTPTFWPTYGPDAVPIASGQGSNDQSVTVNGITHNNSGCVFIGHVLQFYPTNLVPSTAHYTQPNIPSNQLNTTVIIYTIAGRAFTKTTSSAPSAPVTSLRQAEPQIIHNNVNNDAYAPDTHVPYDETVLRLPPGLSISSVYWFDSAYNTNNSLGTALHPYPVQYDSMIGFFNGFPGAIGDNTITSGLANNMLIPVPSNNGSGTGTGNEFMNQYYMGSTPIGGPFFCTVGEMDDVNYPTIADVKTTWGFVNADRPNCDTVNTHAASTAADPSGGVQICVKSNGISNEQGLITIGGSTSANNSNPLNVKESTHYGANCPTDYPY